MNKIQTIECFGPPASGKTFAVKKFMKDFTKAPECPIVTWKGYKSKFPDPVSDRKTRMIKPLADFEKRMMIEMKEVEGIKRIARRKRRFIKSYNQALEIVANQKNDDYVVFHEFLIQRLLALCVTISDCNIFLNQMIGIMPRSPLIFYFTACEEDFNQRLRKRYKKGSRKYRFQEISPSIEMAEKFYKVLSSNGFNVIPINTSKYKNKKIKARIHSAIRDLIK